MCNNWVETLQLCRVDVEYHSWVLHVYDKGPSSEITFSRCSNDNVWSHRTLHRMTKISSPFLGASDSSMLEYHFSVLSQGSELRNSYDTYLLIVTALCAVGLNISWMFE